MRCTFRWAALLLLAVFVLPVIAADDPKDAKKDTPKDVKKDDAKDVKKDDAKKDDAKKDAPKADPKKDDPKADPKKDAPKKDDPKKDDPKNSSTKDVKPDWKDTKKDSGMVPAGKMLGTLISQPENGKSLRFKIEQTVTTLNTSAAQAMQQGQLEYLQAQAKRDVQGMISAQNKIASNQKNLYTSTKSSTEVEYVTTDDCVVRLAEPPPTFDDKGKIKKLTAKEKAELKGDPKLKLPGYKAEFADLHTNQLMEIHLVVSKSAKNIKINPYKSKDLDPALLAERKPKISLLYIRNDLLK